jgi:hypothetical protein
MLCEYSIVNYVIVIKNVDVFNIANYDDKDGSLKDYGYDFQVENNTFLIDMSCNNDTTQVVLYKKRVLDFIRINNIKSIL